MEESKDLSIPAVVGAIHGQSAIVPLECVSSQRIYIATANETETAEESNAATTGISLMYLKQEFPSLWPHICSTVSHSLINFFVSFLPENPRIRDVLWAFEPHLLRIWTVVDEPEFELEEPIYEAQRRFLEKIDEIACDFTVVYAFGKPIDDIRPTGAVSVK